MLRFKISKTTKNSLSASTIAFLMPMFINSVLQTKSISTMELSIPLTFSLGKAILRRFTAKLSSATMDMVTTIGCRLLLALTLKVNSLPPRSEPRFSGRVLSSRAESLMSSGPQLAIADFTTLLLQSINNLSYCWQPLISNYSTIFILSFIF